MGVGGEVVWLVGEESELTKISDDDVTEKGVLVETDMLPVEALDDSGLYRVTPVGLGKSLTVVQSTGLYQVSSFIGAESAFLQASGRPARVGDMMVEVGGYGTKVFMKILDTTWGWWSVEGFIFSGG